MATEKTAMEERAVIVTTTHKGVFFGYATDTSGEAFMLRDACMAIYWGTTKGLLQLATTGPTPKSLISTRATIEVRGVNLVLECTPEAVAAWEAKA